MHVNGNGIFYSMGFCKRTIYGDSGVFLAFINKALLLDLLSAMDQRRVPNYAVRFGIMTYFLQKSE